MSLIHDALKTAQRERSGQAKGASGSQPLLDGFFPYVSPGAAKGRSSQARVAFAALGLFIVLGLGLWFATPAIRLALKPAPKQPTIALAPRRAPAETPATTPDPERTAPATATATSTDSTPTGAATAEVRLAGQEAQDKAPIRAAVKAEKPVTSRQTATIQPLENPGARPDPPASGSVDATRPNLEAAAVAAFNVGDYPTARVRFEAALRAIPTASGWTNYGVTLEKLGDGRAAADAYQKAMGIDPNYLNAWLYLARIYAAGGDVQRAVPLFNRALEIDPTNSDVNADLAELEFKVGAFSEARHYADVAARSNDSNPRAHYYLALAADTLKDRDLARRGFEDFLRTIAGQERENSASVGYARVRLQELKGKP